MTEQQTCEVGRGTDRPCLHPATERMFGKPVCEGHRLLYELVDDETDLLASLDHLKRWTRVADRHGIKCLQEVLRTIREDFTAELEELEAKSAR